MAHGLVIEAEYSDGFVLNEEAHGDRSPYDEGRNIFNAIVESRPVDEHGPMIRWTCFTHLSRLDVDWRQVPLGSRPVMEHDLERDFDAGSGEPKGPARVMEQRFGYEFDVDGETVREVQEIGA